MFGEKLVLVLLSLPNGRFFFSCDFKHLRAQTRKSWIEILGRLSRVFSRIISELLKELICSLVQVRFSIVIGGLSRLSLIQNELLV